MSDDVIKNLNRFVDKKFNAGLARGLDMLCQQIVGDAAKNLNSREHKSSYSDGTLAASLTYFVDEEKLEATIGTNVEYAIYVHQGTGLFAEKGDGRKEVPWVYKTADGKWHSTKGQKPNPFLRRALDEDVPKYGPKAFVKGVDVEWKM